MMFVRFVISYLIVVCTDTYVFYQNVLEKKTYESQIWSLCIAKRRNIMALATLWRQLPVVSVTTHSICIGIQGKLNKVNSTTGPLTRIIVKLFNA